MLGRIDCQATSPSILVRFVGASNTPIESGWYMPSGLSIVTSDGIDWNMLVADGCAHILNAHARLSRYGRITLATRQTLA